MLNPATITLTGMLAVPTVEHAVNEYLLGSKPFGNHPDVKSMHGEANRLIRVRGAALAVLRAQVHRKMTELVGGSREEARKHVKALTEPLKRFPWER